MGCSPPGSSAHGDSPGKNTGVGCHALLQGIFPTQGSNWGLLHCRQILYHWALREVQSSKPQAQSDMCPEPECYSWTCLQPDTNSRSQGTHAKTSFLLQSYFCSLCNVPSECSQDTQFNNVHAGELPRYQGSAFFMFFLKRVCSVFIEIPNSVLDAVISVCSSGNSINSVSTLLMAPFHSKCGGKELPRKLKLVTYSYGN